MKQSKGYNGDLRPENKRKRKQDHNSKSRNVSTLEKLQKIYQISVSLTLKAPISTAADDNFDFYFIFQGREIDISCESSAKQKKCQDIFSENRKKIKCRLLQVLLCALTFNLLLAIHTVLFCSETPQESRAEGYSHCQSSARNKSRESGNCDVVVTRWRCCK